MSCRREKLRERREVRATPFFYVCSTGEYTPALNVGCALDHVRDQGTIVKVSEETFKGLVPNG